jgi:DNA-binding transcriptional regulator GbsR (MarR family)
MAKLVNFIPGRQIQKEALDDMDAPLPAQMERFLDRAIRVIRGYNLSRKKEQFVIAKIIDALGLSPAELSQAVQKLKKNKVVSRLNEAPDMDISSLVKKIEKHTDRNAHTDAVIELEKFLKQKKFENILNSIMDIHLEMGSMPAELSKLRGQILDELMKMVRNKYGNDIYKQINSVY